MKYVSGEVISISDAKGVPAEKVVVDFSPIQDFNGYSRPWAKGHGNNILDVVDKGLEGDDYPSAKGITWTLNTDGTVTANGTAESAATVAVGFKNYPIGDYYFYGCPPGGSSSTYECFIRDTATAARAPKWDGTTPSVSDFGDDSTDHQFRVDTDHWYTFNFRILAGTTVNNLTFKPMIVPSTCSITEFEPYENLCKPEVRDEVNLTVNGTVNGVVFPSDVKTEYTSNRNLYDVSSASLNTSYIFNNSGSIKTGGDDHTYVTHVEVSPNTTYTISFGGSGYVRIPELAEGDVFVKRTLTTTSPLVLTTSSTTVKLQFATDATITNLQVEIGDVASPYEEYHKAYSLDGTYGGYVDITDGKVVVNPYTVISSYAGETITGEWYSDRDLYSSGVSPSLGAFVIYKGSGSSTRHSFTPLTIPLQTGENTLSSDGDLITLRYEEKSSEPTPVIVVDRGQRINYLLACLGGSSSLSDDFRPYSRVEKMLYAKLTGGSYEGSVLSRIEKLFMVYLGFANRSVIDFTPSSRIEEILLSLIDDTTYDQNPLSTAEELLLSLK